MQINTRTLITELKQIIDDSTETVRAFKTYTPEQLNHRATEGSWTALECLEHLNLYGDFYIPEVEKSMFSREHSLPTTGYSPGIMGNYFAGLMKVKQGKIKKMATPKDKNPIHSALTLTTLDRFLKQQEKWTKLLNMAVNADLGKTKTAISLTRLIRLKLGDTLRFCVYHIERHVQQAERALNTASK